jgi:alpha-tubulin suppressor-like RCC1 family protein
MSGRYLGAWEQAGLFNPLNAPPAPTYTYYLYTWGSNNYGQLGLNNTTYYSSPKQVGSLTSWSFIAPSGNFTIATKTDGTLWGWGNNNSGQLGLGNQTYYSSPKQIGALTNWLNAKLSCNSNAVMAVKADGTLWFWGNSASGSSGLGVATAVYSSPKQVGSLTNWSTISITSHSVAVKKDGTLWSWGRNTYGELGLGNTTYYSSPKQVGALTNWVNASAASLMSFAIKNDGTIWAFGRNNGGQLGLNNSTYYSSPVQIGALNTWSKITSDSYNTGWALRNDGTLWAWGNNSYGQLGQGNTVVYSSPKQIGALTNWSSITPNFMLYYGANAIKTNGTLWTWGRNHRGQLGLGNVTNYSSPVQVGSLTTWYLSFGSTGGNNTYMVGLLY